MDKNRHLSRFLFPTDQLARANKQILFYQKKAGWGVQRNTGGSGKARCREVGLRGVSPSRGRHRALGASVPAPAMGGTGHKAGECQPQPQMAWSTGAQHSTSRGWHGARGRSVSPSRRQRGAREQGSQPQLQMAHSTELEGGSPSPGGQVGGPSGKPCRWVGEEAWASPTAIPFLI